MIELLRSQPGWPTAHVTGIGMGAGTVSAWSEAGQQWNFIEIDPDVIDVAQKYFSYLADAAAPVRIIEGDGRIEAVGLPASSQQLIILDAYQGDSVPSHLLTAEACALYADKLTPDGVIAVHISNRHLQLAPVVAACADSVGMQALMFTNGPVPADADSAGSAAAQWVMMTSDDELLAAARSQGWVPIGDRVAWSDEQTPLLGVIRID